MGIFCKDMLAATIFAPYLLPICSLDTKVSTKLRKSRDKRKSPRVNNSIRVKSEKHCV